MTKETKPSPKVSYVGAPAIFILSNMCRQLQQTFPGHCYHVGSSLTNKDWRDVDVRMIMDEDDFDRLFPRANHRHWESDPRWELMMIWISKWLSDGTGLPVDFQMWPRQQSSVQFRGRPCQPLGLSMPEIPEVGCWDDELMENRISAMKSHFKDMGVDDATIAQAENEVRGRHHTPNTKVYLADFHVVHLGSPNQAVTLDFHAMPEKPIDHVSIKFDTPEEGEGV